MSRLVGRRGAGRPWTTALLTLLLCAATASGEQAVLHDAVAIGAGWAGINFARNLLDNGYEDVVIIEANDYVGGRSKSVNMDGSVNVPPDELAQDNVPFDMGSGTFTDLHLISSLPHEPISTITPEYLYTGNDVKSYLVDSGMIESVDLSAVDTAPHVLRGSPSIGYYRKPRSSDVSVPISSEAMEGYYNSIWRPFSRYLDELLQLDEGWKLSLKESLDMYASERSIPNFYLQYLNLMIDAGGEIEYGGESAEMSIWDHDLDAVLANDGTPIHLMSGVGVGFGNTVARVAREAQLMDKIQLNSKVTRIDYSDPDFVQIEYIQNGETRKVFSRTAVVTVSLGVLKAGTIEFFPELTRNKQRSISQMSVGLFNKCVMTWNDSSAVVWPEDPLAFELITPDSETSGRWTTFQSPTKFKGGLPTLVGWIAGDEAVRAEAQSDDEILGEVMANLRSMFPDITDPDDVIITRWGAFVGWHFEHCNVSPLLSTRSGPQFHGILLVQSTG